MKKKYLFIAIFVFIVSVTFSGFSQTKNSDINNAFANYTKNFQEVVHVHLNKSNYIVGEDVGFTAYVFNKNDHSLSKETENLYCVITDENDKVVKSSLIKVTNGIASGAFKLEDHLASANYTFKAYTNWMRNFKQNNAFVENFKIINPKKTKGTSKISRSNFIDIQFLPESGNLLSDVTNTVGVIAKDTLGVGFGNISGKIVDSNNKFITDFKLNKLGIGRFTIKPKLNEKYTAVLDNKTSYNTNLNANFAGIILKLVNHDTHAIVSIVTNSNLPENIRKDSLHLVLHNGKKLKKFAFTLNDRNEFSQKIDFNSLDAGTQIITLFNANFKPIAERLFFNYQGLDVLSKSEVNKILQKDSITINLNYGNKAFAFNNVSVSVLPEGTNAYQKNATIISQSLIQPYLKSYVEDGGYYFKNINDKTSYDLDNLLITQGWSSYDWNTIFNHNSNMPHKFEKGISINVNLPDTLKNQKLMMHHLKNSDGMIIDVSAGTKYFTALNLFPENDEKLYFSKLTKSGSLNKVPLYVQFYPNHVPNHSFSNAIKKPEYFTFESYNQANIFSKLNERIVLDEVVVKANLKEQRKLDLRRSSTGRLFYLDDTDRNLTLAEYIKFRTAIGWRIINNPNIDANFIGNSPNGGRFFIDDMLILDSNILYEYRTSYVEYIDFPFDGSIRVYTSPELMFKSNNLQTVNEISFPLTYAVAEKFYIPKYQSYKDDFFQKYGVIDWKPINKIDENGNLNFTIDQIKGTNIRLFIEGVTANGTYIFEEKVIDLSNTNN